MYVMKFLSFSIGKQTLILIFFRVSGQQPKGTSPKCRLQLDLDLNKVSINLVQTSYEGKFQSRKKWRKELGTLWWWKEAEKAQWWEVDKAWWSKEVCWEEGRYDQVWVGRWTGMGLPGNEKRRDHDHTVIVTFQRNWLLLLGIWLNTRYWYTTTCFRESVWDFKVIFIPLVGRTCLICRFYLIFVLVILCFPCELGILCTMLSDLMTNLSSLFCHLRFYMLFLRVYGSYSYSFR